MKGTVKKFDPLKGYGFITGEDGQDYFVHKSALKGSITLAPGVGVTFDGSQGDRGMKADNVALAGAEEAPAEETAEESSEESSEEENKEE